MSLMTLAANLTAGPLRNIKFPSPCRRLMVFLLDSEEGTQKSSIHDKLGLRDIPKCDYLIVHSDAYYLVEFSDIAEQQRSLLADGVMLQHADHRKPDGDVVLREVAAEMRRKAMGSLLAFYNLHAKFKICVAKMSADGVEEFRRKKLIFIVVAENSTFQAQVFMQSIKTRIEGGMSNLFSQVKVISPDKFENLLCEINDRPSP